MFLFFIEFEVPSFSFNFLHPVFCIMGGCSAYGCSNSTTKRLPGMTFHQFPKDEPQRTKWIIAVRRKNWVPTKHSRLCSAHFEEEMLDRSMRKVVLMPDAVPSIFPGFPSGVFKSNSRRVATDISGQKYLQNHGHYVQQDYLSADVDELDTSNHLINLQHDCLTADVDESNNSNDLTSMQQDYLSADVDELDSSNHLINIQQDYLSDVDESGNSNDELASIQQDCLSSDVDELSNSNDELASMQLKKELCAAFERMVNNMTEQECNHMINMFRSVKSITDLIEIFYHQSVDKKEIAVQPTSLAKRLKGIKKSHKRVTSSRSPKIAKRKQSCL